jgi:hypothetical protein
LIKIIEQSTTEREKETRKLFQAIKPYLDEGMIYSKAVKKVKGLPSSYPCTNLAWFRDVVEYGESKGYSYKKYSGKAGRKKKRLV